VPTCDTTIPPRPRADGLRMCQFWVRCGGAAAEALGVMLLGLRWRRRSGSIPPRAPTRKKPARHRRESRSTREQVHGWGERGLLQGVSTLATTDLVF
jgi:hypothetical protein